MKNIKSFLSISLILLALSPLVARSEEWQGRFPYGIVPLKLSIIEPMQIPIPWYGYDEDVSLWGAYTVCGIDLGFESDSESIYGLAVTGLAWGREDMMGLDAAVAAIRQDVYGLQLGGGAVAKGEAYGWQLGAYTYGRGAIYGLQTGVLNMAGKVRGVQIGVANSCHDLKGAQIGLINLNFGGPLTFFPIVNAAF